MSVSIIYRGPPYFEGTPTSTPWNSGIGTNLTGYQIDSNFYACASAIEALQASELALISNFEIINGDLYITLEDHTTFNAGPLPTADWIPVGEWTADTAYNVLDEFYFNGAAYVVLRPYPGAATFDPNAQNGMGQNYFSPPIIVAPGSVVPTGGHVGQSLLVETAGGGGVPTTEWGFVLPSGGITGDFLKLTHPGSSTTPADAEWVPITAPVAALSATTGTFTNSPDFADIPHAIYTCTPTGNITLNTASLFAGCALTFVITTSGGTSYNFTFGTNFKSQGALATGTSSGAVFTVSFECDGTNWNETSRTTAM